MSKLVFFGVGAELVVDYEETCARLGATIVAGVQNRDGEVFFSDSARLRHVEALDPTLLGVPCLCPIFTPSQRKIAVGEAADLGFRAAPALIDPTSTVASSTPIGDGGYVNAACVVGGAGQIGRQVIVNRGSGIGHHATIGDFVSIGPGVVIAGHVTIGQGSLIGAGAVILPRIRIGANAVVGAGSVVTRDVADHALVMGTPARFVRSVD